MFCDVCCLLFAVGCLLFVGGCALRTARYTLLLFVLSPWFLVLVCWFCVVCLLLFVDLCVLFGASCVLCFLVVCGLLYVV